MEGTLLPEELKSENKRVVRQRIYDAFDFSSMKSPAYRNYPKPLSERIKQSAFYRALTIVRLWLMRTHILSRLIDALQEQLSKDLEMATRFLKGENLYGEAMDPFYEATSYDVFDRKQFMTNYFLNNHLKQLKNLLLSSKNPAIRTHVKSLTAQLLGTTPRLTPIIEKSIGNMGNSFKKKEKGRYVPVGPENVLLHLMKQFIWKINMFTTYDAKGILFQKNKMANLQEKERKKRDLEKKKRFNEQIREINALLKKREERLISFFPELEMRIHGLKNLEDLKEFKKERKALLADRKLEYLERTNFNLPQYLKDALTEKLSELGSEESSKNLLLSIFSPSFGKISVNSLSFDSFKTFVKTKIEYAIRSELKTLFLSTSEEFLGIISEALVELKGKLEEQVNIPTVKHLTLQIQDSQNYRADYDALTASLSFFPHDFIDFRINDAFPYRNKNTNKYQTKSRIQELLEYDNIEAKLPSITLKNGKILLSLPFEVKKTSSSNRPYPPLVERNKDISVKVDLGLKHFAVVSVVQKGQIRDSISDYRKDEVEIARYFLGVKELFDMKFTEGKLVVPESNFYDSEGLLSSIKKKASNIFLKIRALRNEIARVQKQKDAYKNAHPNHFRNKYKYYRLRRQYRLLWERIYHLNRAITCHTSQKLLQIVNYYGACTLYFEDLKWSSHKKRAQSGKYLSFMSVHWIHGQIQDHVEQRGQIEGIRVKRVNAAYTSQRCSECGLIEYKDRDGMLVYLKEGLSKTEQKKRHLTRTSSRNGKLFECRNSAMHPHGRPFLLDSDLNASRNVMPT